MQPLYQELCAFAQKKQPFALATLVGTSGSSPQNTGAKVLFFPDGRIVGTIGGGCMEAEARRIALDCLRKKTTRLFDLRLDDDFGWDDGLICGGSVHIFIHPDPAQDADIYEAALSAAASRQKAVLITAIRGDSELLGRTALLTADGTLRGAPVWQKRADALHDVLQNALASGRARSVEVDAETSVYAEPIVPRPTLLIAGAGHIGASLAQICALCDFEVVVVDDRASLCNTERLPFADRAVVDDIPRFVRDFPINEDTFVVIVTRGHRHDAHVLRECIHSNARYLGMIGSKRKICVIYEEMLREGLATPDELRRVHSPLGLTIGSREVGEIAVSIAAELVAVRRGTDLTAVRPHQYTPPFLKS